MEVPEEQLIATLVGSQGISGIKRRARPSVVIGAAPGLPTLSVALTLSVGASRTMTAVTTRLVITTVAHPAVLLSNRAP